MKVKELVERLKNLNQELDLTIVTYTEQHVIAIFVDTSNDYENIECFNNIIDNTTQKFNNKSLIYHPC